MKKGRVLFEQDKSAEARDCLCEAVRLDPEDDEAWWWTAVCLEELREPAEAVRCLEKVAELTPGVLMAHVRCGRLRCRLGDCRGAVGDANTALEIDPDYAEALALRARAYCGLGQHDRAADDAKAAIAAKPKLAEAHEAAGLALAGKRDYDRAIKHYRKAIRLDRGLGSAYRHRAEAYFRKGKARKARKDLALAVKFGYQPEERFVAELERGSP